MHFEGLEKGFSFCEMRLNASDHFDELAKEMQFVWPCKILGDLLHGKACKPS
jgi:hypothetical protein